MIIEEVRKLKCKRLKPEEQYIYDLLNKYDIDYCVDKKSFFISNLFYYESVYNRFWYDDGIYFNLLFMYGYGYSDANLFVAKCLSRFFNKNNIKVDRINISYCVEYKKFIKRKTQNI